MTRRGLVLAALAALIAAGPAAAQTPPAGARTVILSTTTSTQDSGLLDVLVPMFEQATGYSVKTISVGTGQALALAARGEADVTLAHAPAAREEVRGRGQDAEPARRHVQRLHRHRPRGGPGADQGRPAAAEALRRIAAAERAVRVARRQVRDPPARAGALEAGGDRAEGRPGTSSPARAWARPSGIANDRRAYTLTDRGTYLAFQKRVDLPVLVEGTGRS